MWVKAGGAGEPDDGGILTNRTDEQKSNGSKEYVMKFLRFKNYHQSKKKKIKKLKERNPFPLCLFGNLISIVLA